MAEAPAHQQVYSGHANECTSGFMSVDGIEVMINNYGVSFANNSKQEPEINFTCAGSTQPSLSYRYGRAVYRDGMGPILKSGALQSCLNLIGQNSTSTFSPLPCPFKKEDNLGYYQPATIRSQLGLVHKSTGSITDQLPASFFSAIGSTEDGRFHVLVGVETGK